MAFALGIDKVGAGKVVLKYRMADQLDESVPKIARTLQYIRELLGRVLVMNVVSAIASLIIIPKLVSEAN